MNLSSWFRDSRIVLAAIVGVAILACSPPRQQVANQTVRYGDDIIASGSSPSIADSVAGDVILLGGEMQFPGTAGGDYLGFGGSQVVTGRVVGSLRAAGGQIHVRSAIGRNATIAGGEITLEDSAFIGRNAYLAGGTVTVDGTVGDILQVAAGTVVINGRIGRDVEVYAGSLHIGPNAEIAGNLRYRVPPQSVSIDSSAQIMGTVNAVPIPKERDRGYIFSILWALAFLAAGIVLIALFPRFTAECVDFLRARPASTGMIGLGWIIATPIVIVLLAITIIGIPLALMTSAVYTILVYFGRVLVSIWIGYRALGARARPGLGGMMLNFVLGAIILLLLGQIPIVGWIVTAVATVLGFGAFLYRIWTMRNSESAWRSNSGPVKIQHAESSP